MAVLVLILSVLFANIVLSTSCDIIENGIRDEDIQDIVNKHNNLRQLISEGKVPGQPKGVNLKTLKWDAALAEKAQEIADTCQFKHVNVNDDRWSLGAGQNLGWTWGYPDRAKDWDQVIQDWFDEYTDFTYPNTSTGVTGHYLQVVYGDTEYIGCGYTQYKELYRENLGEGNLYVCNYGPRRRSDRLPYQTA